MECHFVEVYEGGKERTISVCRMAQSPRKDEIVFITPVNESQPTQGYVVQGVTYLVQDRAGGTMMPCTACTVYLRRMS